MKKTLAALFILILAGASLACNKKFTVPTGVLDPIPGTTPTQTATLTPCGCIFTATAAVSLTLVPTPTATITLSVPLTIITPPCNCLFTPTASVTLTDPPLASPSVTPAIPVTLLTPTVTWPVPVSDLSPTETWSYPVSNASPTLTIPVSILPTATQAVTDLSPTLTPPPGVWPTSTASPITFGTYNTPTPNPTPGCGFTPVAGESVSIGGLGNFTQTNPTGAPFAVIRSLDDWNAFFGASYSFTPPVDFASQMLILVVNSYPCAYSTMDLTDVCETSDGVSVSLTNYTPNFHCMVATMGYSVSAAAVANTGLPVTWSVSEVSGNPPSGLLP